VPGGPSRNGVSLEGETSHWDLKTITDQGGREPERQFGEMPVFPCNVGIQQASSGRVFSEITAAGLLCSKDQAREKGELDKFSWGGGGGERRVF